MSAFSAGGGRTLNYAYDALNRVTSGTTQATSGADCWGQTVPSSGYDRYGNLSIINVSQCSAPALNLSVNANNHNQIDSSGFTYDAAGDMTGDGMYNYVWNGAGLLKSAGGVTYTYDGNYNRVEKSSGTLYWRGLGGNVLAETDTSGNTLDEYVYFAGSRIARRDASGNVYYYFPDTLGSEVSITNATGTTCFDADFYLFGGEKVFTSNCPPSYKFAGMERDSETGLDHTLFRQYSSQFGRWMTPDPLGGDVTNPQSLNRYAYALNNPTTLTDPMGLYVPSECGDSGSTTDPRCFGGNWNCDSLDPWYPCYYNGPYGRRPEGGGGGGGTLSSASPAGQPPLLGLMNSSGMPCIEPSWLTSLALYAGEGAAKFLNWKNGKTQSVGWGAGGSLAGGKYGGGGTASGSWLDTVDINGNAAQVETVESGPAIAFGGAAIGGAQVQTSNNPVPQTPQSSKGWGYEPTTSIGAGAGYPAASVDLHKGGGTTITYGAGWGVKGVSTNLLPAYIYTKSIPYCW